MKPESIQKFFEQIQQNEKPLNFREACSYLGISSSHLYKLTHKNKIAFFKPAGKLIYFLKEDLRKYLLRNRTSTEEEIELKAIEHVTLGSGDAQ